jgi:hypothetical protein
MPGDLGKDIAQKARDAASAKDEFYDKLCADMCWTAVLRSAMEGGALEAKKFESIKAKFAGEKLETFKDFISQKDPVVFDKASMQKIPQGCFLGFIEEKDGKAKIIHAMVSVGAGMACGTKNGCVGIGAPMGWELLDLAKNLNWLPDQQALNAYPKGTKAERVVKLHYRAIGKIK